jgi:hypothetical protein
MKTAKEILNNTINSYNTEVRDFSKFAFNEKEFNLFVSAMEEYAQQFQSAPKQEESKSFIQDKIDASYTKGWTEGHIEGQKENAPKQEVTDEEINDLIDNHCGTTDYIDRNSIVLLIKQHYILPSSKSEVTDTREKVVDYFSRQQLKDIICLFAIDFDIDDMKAEAWLEKYHTLPTDSRVEAVEFLKFVNSNFHLDNFIETKDICYKSNDLRNEKEYSEAELFTLFSKEKGRG